ncbi:MAG: HEAT repeat domain-containing protein, partial [Phormidesmis sp. CAN_BIN44]|nr:HEAT repeat domain-containing protein [Phormidesmis sp. CAN_BIN44]
MLELLEDEREALRVVRSALDVDWQLGAKLAGKVKLEWQEKTISFVQALELPQMLKIHLLGVTRSEAAILALIELLKDEDSNVRRSVTYEFGKIGLDAAIPALIGLLQDEDSNVRESATYALDEIGSDAAVSVLIELHKKSDSNVRRSVTYEFSKIDLDTDILGLIELLKDE